MFAHTPASPLAATRPGAPRARSASVAGLACLAALLLLAGRADAVYLFFMRQDLALALQRTPQELVGKQVCFTDELAVIWPEAQERPSRLGGKRHVLFDTAYFRCAVPQDRMETHLEQIWTDAQRGYGEARKKINEINDELLARKITLTEAQTRRRELYWELYRLWKNKPIVTVYGKVERADFWGGVRGRDQGVATEAITIVVDRVEKPRDRWYDSLDD